MKKSLNYLPPEKRRDLRQLVEIIRNVIKDCEMIILYGSYARGDYVDYDQRIEFNVRTYYMSDYDILILTEKSMGSGEQTLYGKIHKQFYNHKSIEFHTRPQFINESVKEFNTQIERGQYFYTDIKKQGVMLYDSGNYKIARARKLNYGEVRDIAQKYYDNKISMADDFLFGARIYNEHEKYNLASFNLHQAAENYLRTIPMVYTLYGYKEHDLKFLQDKAKTYHLDICKAFPRLCEEDERLFKLIQDAYVQSRYNSNFVVTKEDLDTLTILVEDLGEIVKQICQARLDEYEQLSKGEKGVSCGEIN